MMSSLGTQRNFAHCDIIRLSFGRFHRDFICRSRNGPRALVSGDPLVCGRTKENLAWHGSDVGN
jgi:hypothetical protein